MVRRPSPLRPLVPVLAGAALLAGCGGGDTPPTPAESTGVLSDSPVKGVSYRRDGTDAGQTDVLGQFKYRPGEVIEFRIGKLVIGTVTGTGTAMTVTPIELAQALAVADRPDRVTNLLVLLQSLDADGDATNGIDIPAAAVAQLDEDAEIAKLDLDAAPATFLADTDLDAIVTAINTAGGSAAKPASTTAALDHFRQEFLSALAGNYIGSIGSNAVALRVQDTGSYLIGEIGVAGSGGSAGLERGSLDWDPATGEVTIALPAQDTNGSWGFSYIRSLAHVQFRVDAGDLVVNERNASGAVTATYRLDRHYNSTTSLAGTWAKGSTTSLQTLHLFLRGDGSAMVLNPAADQTPLRAGASACATAGVEFGNYGISSGLLVFSGVTSFDTDACGGVHDTTSGAHFLPTITALNYASTMGLGWTSTLAGFQSATLYRPDNTVAP